MTSSTLRSFSGWLQEIGVSPVTGWRYRRRGWITPVNIAGRLFVAADEIARFTERAKQGEFAAHQRPPLRRNRSLQEPS